ncbi:MAG: hypothetical protein KJ558_08010 [Gammaproteobacteria bacterium]|nr:hypothetical protein [Gammaproteobacteria bacterium]MBU1654758.1 hypothetical protein [Gammaproteobacteria bacterium]MBU1961633.1 hypothetical protein [Gammaproteobacteria bacterium]
MPVKTILPDIVSNTGPLISLERVGFSFIRGLYRKILIPRSVLLEISCNFRSPGEYLLHQRGTCKMAILAILQGENEKCDFSFSSFSMA